MWNYENYIHYKATNLQDKRIFTRRSFPSLGELAGDCECDSSPDLFKIIDMYKCFNTHIHLLCKLMFKKYILTYAPHCFAS
jgi:hypothetical protein